MPVIVSAPTALTLANFGREPTRLPSVAYLLLTLLVLAAGATSQRWLWQRRPRR